MSTTARRDPRRLPSVDVGFAELGVGLNVRVLPVGLGQLTLRFCRGAAGDPSSGGVLA